jgi:hypothetical protein
VSSLFHLPAGFNDWRIALGATAHLGRVGVTLLIAAAVLAVLLSALSLAEERRLPGWLLLLLRTAGVLACLLTALQPTVELRQITRCPTASRCWSTARDRWRCAPRRRAVARRARRQAAAGRGAAAGGVAAGGPRGRPLHVRRERLARHGRVAARAAGRRRHAHRRSAG